MVRGALSGGGERAHSGRGEGPSPVVVRVLSGRGEGAHSSRSEGAHSGRGEGAVCSLGEGGSLQLW